MFDVIKLFFLKSRYERKGLLQHYIRSQYGIFLIDGKYLASESFYKKIIEESKKYVNSSTLALDVGCATGRLVFEYGKLGAEKIIGVDSSKNFIDFCNLMKNGKQNLVLYPHQFLTRCQFLNTDIMKVSEENFFTFITCINVIDRVPNPKVLIEKLYDILDFGGILLLVVPYDWAFSPAPQKYHTRDIKSLLDSNLWMIEKEIRDVSYTFPLDKNNNINYKAHFIIVKKIFSR